MKKFYYLLILATLVVVAGLQSCKKENVQIDAAKGLQLNVNEGDLGQRITTYHDEIVVPIVKIGNNQLMSIGTKKRMSVDISSQFNLNLVADIKAPVYNGNTLQATEVTVNGNRAYVSYNTQGSTYLGGIDVVDITDAGNPKLLQSGILPGNRHQLDCL